MARQRKGKAKKTGSVTVNFKGVQSRQLLPEDDYRVKLTEAEQKESSSGDDMIEFVYEVSEGKYEGQKLWFYCPLGEKSLWKLHALLTAMGIEVPDDELDLDLEQMVEDELELMAVVQHETYDGTKRSKMMDFYAIEEPAEGRKGGKDEKGSKKDKKKDEPKKVAKEKVEEMDRDELEELITDMDLDVDPEDFKKLPKLLAAVLEELEEKELLEEDEPEPETKSKGRRRRGAKDEEEPKERKRGRKNKELPKLSADEIQGMDEDELGEVVEKYGLDTDLDDFKSLRKKAAAVIDALEDKDMIEED